MFRGVAFECKAQYAMPPHDEARDEKYGRREPENGPKGFDGPPGEIADMQRVNDRADAEPVDGIETQVR